MRFQRARTILSAGALCLAGWTQAQTDGDHPITDPVSNITYLAPDANVNLGATVPTGFTVGTAPNAAASLVVDGAQLGDFNTFWTHANQPIFIDWQNWRMNKTSPGQAPTLGVGSIFCRGGTDNTFNINALVDNLRFHTNSIPRAALYYRVADVTINNEPAFNQSGYFALSGRQQFFNWGGPGTGATGSPGPFSRFHMVDAVGTNTPTDYAPEIGFRGWMRNGITFTGNRDQMYIGHKYSSTLGISRAILQFSEGALDGNRQYLSMVFTGDPALGGVAGSTDGLEIMRLWPESSTSAFVGVGDFLTATTNPAERLHLLDRTIMLQAFASSSPVSWEDLTGTYDRVLVADPADGRVYWRPASDFGAPGCQWTLIPGTGAGTNDMYTAVNTAVDQCPDETEAVGIGVDLLWMHPKASSMCAQRSLEERCM